RGHKERERSPWFWRKPSFRRLIKAVPRFVPLNPNTLFLSSIILVQCSLVRPSGAALHWEDRGSDSQVTVARLAAYVKPLFSRYLLLIGCWAYSPWSSSFVTTLFSN